MPYASIVLGGGTPPGLKVTMDEGLLSLAVVALLAAFCVRWVAVKLRMPMPTRAAVIIVFVLVVGALYGEHLRG
ncbi:hypothetical protein amrb99_50340 [Actinomadura sp. RB99]|nr:hypothetical protein [Actinomadura sp. RB99]